MTLLERRPRVADVAARAGVSTATVDRVINGRGSVHHRTVERVEQAIRDIMATDTGGAVAASAFAIEAVLSGDGGQATTALAQALMTASADAMCSLDVAYVGPMNPAALATRLRANAKQGCSGVAVQALDHALVREAIAELARADIPVVTVLTDIAGVDRLAYFGLDNRAAGRTAGLLMSRLCRNAGKLAVVWGGQLYRSHEERESGFRSVVRSERPDLQCLEVITGADNPSITRARVRQAISKHRDLAGIYCVGGGVSGVAEAIDEAGLGQSLVMIGHNCNAETRPYLVSGTIDAVIHQDMKLIAERVVRCLKTRKPLAIDAGIPIEIITRENMMHR